jgi:hypothetical protein
MFSRSGKCHVVFVVWEARDSFSCVCWEDVGLGDGFSGMFIMSRGDYNVLLTLEQMGNHCAL